MTEHKVAKRVARRLLGKPRTYEEAVEAAVELSLQDFEADGDQYGHLASDPGLPAPAWSRLVLQAGVHLRIQGVLASIWVAAIAVELDEATQCWRAVNAAFEDDLERLCEAVGCPAERVLINGHEYMLYVSAYGD